MLCSKIRFKKYICLSNKCHLFDNEYNGIVSNPLCWSGVETAAGAALHPRGQRSELSPDLRREPLSECDDHTHLRSSDSLTVNAAGLQEILLVASHDDRFSLETSFSRFAQTRETGLKQDSSVSLISTTHLIYLRKKSKTRTRRTLFFLRHASETIPGLHSVS